GNLFRPLPPFQVVVRAWNDGTVVKLAQGIYHERAFDRLPMLADALEDAGCTDATILAHCRGPGPHARGCWATPAMCDLSEPEDLATDAIPSGRGPSRS